MTASSEDKERLDNSPQPIFFTRKAFEGKNSDIREHHYPDGARHVVTRLGARKGGFSFEKAHEIVKDIADYYRVLSECGIPMPPLSNLYVEYEPSIDRSVVVKTSPWAGNEIYTLLKEADPVTDIEYIRSMVMRIAGILSKLATRRVSEWDVEVGIDPHCSNFVVKDDGTISYVDLFPPRIRKGGRAFVEWPEPKTDLGYRLGYFKHFDLRGIVLTAIAQLSRIQPTLRNIFEGILFDALSHTVSETAYNDFIGKIEQAPWKKLANLIETKRHDEARDLIRTSITTELFGVEYNVYTLREIALVLAHKEYMSDDALTAFFHESHFEDALPEEKLQALVERLLSHIP